ncbi:hypothetical protein ACI0X9_004225 [Cronobacter turicensis]
METTYVSFTSNSKHYLVKESEITDRWHSRFDKGVEHLILKNGVQYRATNLNNVTLVDLSDVPDLVIIPLSEPFDF